MRQRQITEQNASAFSPLLPTSEQANVSGQAEAEEQPLETAAQENAEAVTRVKHVLEHEVSRRKRRHRFAALWMTTWMAPICYGVATGHLGDWVASLTHLWVLALYYMAMTWPTLMLIWPRSKRLRHSTGPLSALGDVRLVGPLVEMLRIEDHHVRARAGAALTQLLPHLQASDASLLTTSQRMLLCRVLASPLNDLFRSDLVVMLTRQTKHMADLQVAILKAFEQVGDSKALPVVERLATSPAKTGDQQRVRDAAVACLPALQMRAAQQQAHSTLLRASAARETNPALLLRPADGSVTTEAEELLRPEPEQPTSSDPFASWRDHIRHLYSLILRHA